MTVNQKIRILRKEKNMTISSLAEKVGIYQSLLTRYETGIISYVPVELINKIADVLGCKPSDLIEGDERYTQKKKRNTSTQSITSEEFELISNYRRLPMEVQSLIKEMCALHISVNH
jgi:XRE family transcriptional regulator of biofilm formation